MDHSQGLGLRQDVPDIQMTAPAEWQPPDQIHRKPQSPTTPAPIGSPYGSHGRGSPTASGNFTMASFSERAGAAAYFPAPAPGSTKSHPRSRPAPLQMDSYEYSNYSPLYSNLSTPYSGGLPPKNNVRIDSQSSAAGLLSPSWQGMPPNRQQSYTYHPPGHIRFYNKYWHTSWNMYFFLFAGIAFALGHHFFYKTLDGTEASNQIRMMRYGTALAFLSKASLASAVILAFRQRVWMTVRRKMLTLAAVDSLFAAAEDMSAIFNFEVFRQARVAMVLALYVWCTPLVVVLTSDTLTAQPMTTRQETMCPSIRTLNFSHEGNNDWRTSPKIDNLFELSVSLWNTTSTNQSSESFFDYWTGPSKQFEEVARSAIYQKRPLVRAGAGIEICDMGWNCTFTVNFTGPGYKCDDLASGVGSSPKRLNGAVVPFSIDDLAPLGNFTYIAAVTEGDYSTTQLNDSWPGGIPKFEPPFPKNLGALRTEPVLWFGYAHVDDPAAKQPENSSVPGWDTAYTPKIFGCEHYETEYVVNFNYTGLVQNITVLDRKFLTRVVDTRFLRGVDADDGTAENVTAIPEKNYIMPTDTARYRRAMAYHSIGSQLRAFLNGTIQEPGKNANTDAIQTRLIDQHNYLGVNDLSREVQRLYEDILFSMFFNPRFLAVSWASNPEEVTGNKQGAEKLYPCTRERTDLRYKYHDRDLWAVYSVAIFLAVIGVAFGVAAIREEGLVRNTRFSSIVAATRGPGLEKLPWGAAIGSGDHHPVAGAKVGYGLVPGDMNPGSGETYGFGLEGDVKQRQRDESAGRTPSGLGSPFRRWSRISTQPPQP
ncbi:hypothetical protein CCHL11_10296 [Colletotrichum chlorophyti]|uniref:Formylmethionine deformylase-like protein n=1 Tax=Colletotrichum chlorophyti TaxID=708187 RepID=A0A1Q8S1C3_9PEZI|nr:hypothetical protein CCHL11_10296 [Colletotrichum chlorophyti]